MPFIGRETYCGIVSAHPLGDAFRVRDELRSIGNVEITREHSLFVRTSIFHVRFTPHQDIVRR
jgi:hypothetical protein